MAFSKQSFLSRDANIVCKKCAYSQNTFDFIFSPLLWNIADRYFTRYVEFVIDSKTVFTLENEFCFMHMAALFGHKNCLEKAYKNSPNDLNNNSNEYGVTPLHIAVYSKDKNIDIINFLIENGASCTLKDRAGKTVMDDPWFQKNIVKGKIVNPILNK